MSITVYRDKDGGININAAGYLPRDPKVTEKVVLFSVCYAKDKYLDCRAWANETCGEIAACLERHDTAMVCGVLESYTNKDGEKRDQLAVDCIVPIVVPTPIEPTQEETENAGDYGDYGDNDGDLPY